MAWEKGGRYYTRSRKVNGRVVREYVGGGDVGILVATMDVTNSVDREAAAAARRAERERLDKQDASVGELCRLVDLVARATLIAAGYCQHHRGEWRRKRVRSETGQLDTATRTGNG